MSSLRAWWPSGPGERMLTSVSLVDSLGTGLYLTGGMVYFVRYLGLSHAAVAVGLFCAGLAGLLAVVPMGVLADRVGAKGLLVGLDLGRAVCMVLLVLAHHPVVFALLCTYLGLAERAVPPLGQAIVSSIVPREDRTRTLALMRTVRNLGFAAGAALTAPILAVDAPWAYRALVLGNAGSFALAALLLARYPVPALPVPRPAGEPGPGPGPAPSAQGAAALTGAGAGLVAGVRAALRQVQVLRDGSYARLAALDGALTVHATILGVALPLWILESTTAPTWAISVVVLVNVVLVVAFQVPVATWFGTVARAAPGMRVAALSIAAACLLFGLTGRPGTAAVIALLVAGTVALTAGEVLQATTGWEISFHHAPDDRQAEYLAAFSLGYSVQELIGPPLLLGLIAFGLGGWALLAVALLGVAALVGPVLRAARPVERPGQQPDDEPPAPVDATGDVPAGASAPTTP